MSYSSGQNATYAGYGGGSKESKPTINSNKQANQSFFAQKGEVADLQKLLKIMLKDQKNHKKLRDVVKKVIAFMTLGIDVSSLFSEMCMLSFTEDIITKKMIYLYLTTYSESNSE